MVDSVIALLNASPINLGRSTYASTEQTWLNEVLVDVHKIPTWKWFREVGAQDSEIFIFSILWHLELLSSGGCFLVPVGFLEVVALKLKDIFSV